MKFRYSRVSRISFPGENKVSPVQALTPRSNLLEKLIVAQLVTKFPALYGTQRFIPVFARARHRPQSWLRRIRSTSFYLVSLRSVHLYLGLPCDLILSGFPTQTVCSFAFTPYPARVACPVQLILLDSIILILSGEARYVAFLSDGPLTKSVFRLHFLMKYLSLTFKQGVQFLNAPLTS
jgi:hypothetical protein